MYIRFTSSKKSKNPTLQIVEGIRIGKKVKQKIIASLGVVKDEKDKRKLANLAENFIQKLQDRNFPLEKKISLSKLFHQKTIYDGFGQIVDQLMQLTGFGKIIKTVHAKQSFNVEEIVKLIIVQRLDLPSSKLRTCERQEEHGFYNIELQHIYRTMDAIETLKTDIQKQAYDSVCAYSPAPVDCLFFDVTTLYFESVHQDKIRDFGFSKDQKHNLVQIVLALIVDHQGIPLAYETFKGNVSETKTLIPVLVSLKERFLIENVIVVCDRGLASKTNVLALQKAHFNFVIATKLRSISKKEKLNDLSKYVLLPGQEKVPREEKVLYFTTSHPQYENTTLIITYSPLRAKKDKEERERLLEKLKDKLSGQNKKNIKKMISNNGYKKFTTVQEGSSVTLNEKAIEEDIAWDGFHGIAVSNTAHLTPTVVLSRYHDLWHVEEAFRVTKSSLRTRPIFHWMPHRIEAHVLLCFMTLFFERFLELLLRSNNTPLTPDRIRYALQGVHTAYFEEQGTNSLGQMPSSLTVDAQTIFKTLGISLDRSVKTSCCV